MTDKEYQAMLDRDQARKLAKQEKAQAQAERRKLVLERAIRSNRVTVDGARMDESVDARAFFDRDMARIMRTQAYDDPSSED